MRIVLLSWVNEVCAEMRFSRITLHTSLALIDHYFFRATYIIPIEEFQVIGVTSIWVAAKMEEIFVPAVKYFSKATGGSSSDYDITCMERRLLTTLGFRLNPVTIVHFADWYTRQWDAFAT
jgi:cyclin E